MEINEKTEKNILLIHKSMPFPYFYEKYLVSLLKPYELFDWLSLNFSSSWH